MGVADLLRAIGIPFIKNALERSLSYDYKSSDSMKSKMAFILRICLAGRFVAEILVRWSN